MPDNLGFSAVDLFCGVGGLTHGLLRAGIPVKAGIDIDEGCRYSYEINNGVPFINKDVAILTSGEIRNLFDNPKKKILVGCAPCQPFSSYTHKIKNREKDIKWKLLYSFARIVRSVEPEIISIENVPNLINYDPFKNLISILNKMKYYVNYSVVHCENFGIPQHRKRLVLLASKFGKIELPEPTHSSSNYVTVKDAIGNLSKLDCGKISEKDPLHRAQKLSDLNIRRITESKPGNTWNEWSEELKCDCHKKESGFSFKAVYGRMEWDKPAPTITTQFFNYGSGRFGHPEQNRALSLREGALLQSFPNDYIFGDPSQKKPIMYTKIGTHIGNAVPVKLGEAIGLTIRTHIERCYLD